MNKAKNESICKIINDNIEIGEKREQKVISLLATKLNNFAEIQRADSKKNHEEQNAFLKNIDELKADLQKHDIPGIKEDLSYLQTGGIPGITSLCYTIPGNIPAIREAIHDIQNDVRNLRSNRHQRSSNRHVHMS